MLFRAPLRTLRAKRESAENCGIAEKDIAIFYIL
jgi:hypothetical protein